MAMAYNKKVKTKVLKKRPGIEKDFTNIRRRSEQIDVKL
jgi:hypothetical protein